MLLLSPRGIWGVHLLNIGMACAGNLLNHFKVVKGHIMTLTRIKLLISFGGKMKKMFWKTKVKYWPALRSGTMWSTRFQAWISPSWKQKWYPRSKEELKEEVGFWTRTCRELTQSPTYYCQFDCISRAGTPNGIFIFNYKAQSYKIQLSIFVMALSHLSVELRRYSRENPPARTSLKYLLKERAVFGCCFLGSHIFSRQCQSVLSVLFPRPIPGG